MADDIYVPYLSIGPAKVTARAGKEKKGIPLIIYLLFQNVPSLVPAFHILSPLKTEGFADDL